MATRTPLVVINGQQQQLQAGDSFVDVGAYAPGSLTIAAGTFASSTKRITLTGSQRVTITSDGRLRVDG